MDLGGYLGPASILVTIPIIREHLTEKKTFLSVIAHITSLPPPPNSGKYNCTVHLFSDVKNVVLARIKNQVTMITTMMGVIIVILIFIIKKKKIIKKYHII